jgi:hypothetical protein
MTYAAVPLCHACDRYQPATGGLVDDDVPASCAAFPTGIPDTILIGGFDHRRPHDGDHGVRFALRPGAGAELTAYEVDRARPDELD